MKRKIIILLLLTFLLTGCWDYVGLDEITIVTGIAVDKNEKDKKYNLTFEYASLVGSTKDKGMVTKYIESSGKTVFEAVRNAKRRITNKLYFANAQLLVLSDKLAKKGINDAIYWFLRDREVRETIYLAIAKDVKAKDILTAKTVDNPSTAYDLRDIIRKDNDVTSSTKSVMLYEAYDILNNSSEKLALPVFHLVKNDNKKVVEAYGIGLFNKDKMFDVLNATESRAYLFAEGNVKGGILALKKLDDKDCDISLDIYKSDVKKSYKYKDKKIKMTIAIDTTVYIGEYENQPHKLNDKDINKIKKNAAKMVKKDIEKLIKKAKTEYKRDIFGFGSVVYGSNPKLWSKLKKDWDKLFSKSDIKIKSNIKIVNTSYLR